MKNINTFIYRKCFFLIFLFTCSQLARAVESVNIEPLTVNSQSPDEIDITEKVLLYVDHSNQFKLEDIHPNRHVLSFIKNRNSVISSNLGSSTLWLYVPIKLVTNMSPPLSYELMLNTQNIPSKYSTYVYKLPGQNQRNNALTSIKPLANNQLLLAIKGTYHLYVKIPAQNLKSFSVSLQNIQQIKTREASIAEILIGTLLMLFVFLLLHGIKLSRDRYVLALITLSIALVATYASLIKIPVLYQMFLELLYISTYLIIVSHIVSYRFITFSFLQRTIFIILAFTALVLVFFVELRFIIVNSLILTSMLIILWIIAFGINSGKIGWIYLLYCLIPITNIADTTVDLLNLPISLKQSLLGQVTLALQTHIIYFLFFYKNDFNRAEEIRELHNWKQSILYQLSLVAEHTNALIEGNYAHRIALQKVPDIRQLSYHLNSLSQVLNHSQRSRKKWIADVSHELRTPLSILQGEMEAIIDGIRPLDNMAVNSFHQEIRRLVSLVQDLHELSMSDAAQFSLTKKPMAAEPLIEQQLQLFSSTLSKQKITVSSELCESKPTLLLDQDRFTQLLANLLKNTLKYTASPGELYVSTYLRDRQWVLRWEDSAPGVPDNMLLQLFDRFYRGERSRNSRLGGSGLGLSLCKSIVEAHDGVIYAKSSTFGGLCIEVVLPLTLAIDDSKQLS